MKIIAMIMMIKDKKVWKWRKYKQIWKKKFNELPYVSHMNRDIKMMKILRQNKSFEYKTLKCRKIMKNKPKKM